MIFDKESQKNNSLITLKCKINFTKCKANYTI